MLQEPGSQAPARCCRGTAEGFSAALLTGLEKDLLRPVLDHFDLVVGISTGARSPSLSSPPFLLPDRRVDLCRPYRRSVPPVVRPGPSSRPLPTIPPLRTTRGAARMP